MTKQIYNQPQTTIATVALQSHLLAGSPANTISTYNIEGEQW